MDRTELFRATVRSSKLMRSRVSDMNDSSSSSTSGDERSLHTLAASLKKSATTKVCESKFSLMAKSIGTDIAKMHGFLLKTRMRYIDSAGHLTDGSSCMSDEERDAIDGTAEQFMRNCSEGIHSLQREVYEGASGEQLTSHRRVVVESLRAHLKRVCSLYSQQRAIRVKRMVDRRKLARLHTGSLSKGTGGLPSLSKLDEPLGEEEGHHTEDTPYSPSAALTNMSQDLSNEEHEMFQQENVQLLERLHDVSDEVRQIQHKVVHIAELQSIFTEKVMEQAGNIDLVFDNTVKSTENVRAGNEEVREAIKNRATYRAVVMFILIMLSTALLFLNWYT